MNETEKYKTELLASIPVVKGMNISIVEVGERKIILEAPLDENINYEGTAFGGSINTLAVLSSYLLTHHILRTNDLPTGSLVIQDSEIKYLKPVDSKFRAVAEIDHVALDRFLTTFKRRGVARLPVRSNIYVEDILMARFLGRFVAQKT